MPAGYLAADEPGPLCGHRGRGVPTSLRAMSDTGSARVETIGFIGLGVMGAPMVRNLLAAGYEVVAWNRSAGPLEELAAAGARAADGPAAVAREADVVISIVKDDAAVREVLGGPDGAIAAARPGGLVVDMSTVSPAAARELAEEAAARGVAFLDAPVSGGDVGA